MFRRSGVSLLERAIHNAQRRLWGDKLTQYLDPLINVHDLRLNAMRGVPFGLFARINPDREFAVWRFDGAVTATPNYGAATLTGFSAYRQIPSTNLPFNLVKDGGVVVGSSTYWAPADGTRTMVEDAASPSGSAWNILTGGTRRTNRPVDISVEPGQVYSFAIHYKTNDTTRGRIYVDWIGEGAAGVVGFSVGAYSAPTAYTQFTLINQTAPSSAVAARFYLDLEAGGTGGRGTGWIFVQQTTVPAWGYSMQNTVGNKGLAIYEAATNLLANGNADTALSGSLVGFNETFATLNAWSTATIHSAAAGGFTVAANVVSGVASAIRAMYSGHAEWWDSGSNSCVMRFLWRTGGTVRWGFGWDGNEASPTSATVLADGAGLNLSKFVAGTGTAIGSSSVALADNTWYWLDVTKAGTTLTAKVFADSPAGTKSTTQVGATATATDAGVNVTGRCYVVLNSSTNVLQIGGAATTPNPYQVTIPGVPGGWAVGVGSGVPAFCVSKTNKFSGTYSLSVYNNHSGANGWWTQAFTFSNVAYTLSGRVKTSFVVTGAGPGAKLQIFDGVVTNATPLTGTNDWVVNKVTRTTTAGAGNVAGAVELSSGTAWFDLVWLAQQAYDTGNSDPAGQAYVPTGARAASGGTYPIPANLDLDNFAVVIIFRSDMSENGMPTSRILFDLDASIGTEYDMRIRCPDSGGTTSATRIVNGVESTPIPSMNIEWVKGDTLALAYLVSPSTIKLFVSVNGGAVQKSTVTNTQPTFGRTVAQSTLRLGAFRTGGNELNGALAVARFLKGSQSEAYITKLLTTV